MLCTLNPLVEQGRVSGILNNVDQATKIRSVVEPSRPQFIIHQFTLALIFPPPELQPDMLLPTSFTKMLTFMDRYTVLFTLTNSTLYLSASEASASFHLHLFFSVVWPLYDESQTP